MTVKAAPPGGFQSDSRELSLENRVRWLVQADGTQVLQEARASKSHDDGTGQVSVTIVWVDVPVVDIGLSELTPGLHRRSVMIEPTVGRVLHVRQRPGNFDFNQPEVALICYVHSNVVINVAGFDAAGKPFAFERLQLVQEGDKVPPFPYAEWMPYQKGQAAKTEELERRVASGAQLDTTKDGVESK
jgi:hypothetical protein